MGKTCTATCASVVIGVINIFVGIGAVAYEPEAGWYGVISAVMGLL